MMPPIYPDYIERPLPSMLLSPTVYIPMEPPRDRRPAAFRRETAAEITEAWEATRG